MSNIPFGGDQEQPSLQSQKIGLKKVSSQQSVLDSMPKKPNQQDLESKVKQTQERASSYKTRATELVQQYQKSLSDKTLSQNKNKFQLEIEMDLLKNMVYWAQDVNADPVEREGEGSLGLISLLLKNSFSLRDKINNLEYKLSLIEKKLSELDKTNKSE